MTKEAVIELKEQLEYATKQYQNAKDRFELSKRQLREAQDVYRMSEVRYVLENLEFLVRNNKLRSEEISTYLTHCINCLGGNIDGTVLDIDKVVEDSIHGDE